MKNFELLGRRLSKEEQKKVFGGFIGGDGCEYTYTGCEMTGSTVTCDYHVVCSNGSVRDLCGYQCVGNDGWQCNPS